MHESRGLGDVYKRQTVDLASIVITGAPTNGSIVVNANGSVDYTHNGSETLADSFSYTILDNNGAVSNTATVNLTVTPVNDAPTTTPVMLTAISEDSGARLITQAELLANASDVDGNPLTATGLSIASGSGTLVDNGNGTWSYTPVADDDSNVSFNYTVTDGSLTAAGTASLDITPVNDAPVANNDAFTVNEGSTTNLNLAGNDSDIDGTVDPASIVITAAPTNGSIVVNANGTVDYIHDGSETLADSFSYTILDNSGVVSNSGTVTITVTSANDAPVANNDTFTVNEGSTTTLNLASNDTDVDGTVDLTSIVITGTPTNGSITVNTDGTVDYTHDGSETLADSFTYTILDDSGAVSNSGTVNINVTPVNDAPTATNLNSTSSYIEQQGTVQITDIVVSDADSGDIITATLTLADTSAGSLSANDGASYNASTGVWTITDTVGNVNRALKLLQFNPNTDNELNSTISVSIDDGDEDASGPLTGTINLNVTPINDAPVANNDAFTVNEGSTTTLDLAANDADVDSTLDLTSIVITGAPTKGSIVVNADGTVDYTHDGSEASADSFNYTILDDSGKESDSATVNITVIPVNDAPVANNDAFTVIEGSTTTLNLAGNDTDVDDGLDLASITITAAPGNGSIVVNADGSVNYTHDGSETLADSFTYTILDNSGVVSNTGTISLSIMPAVLVEALTVTETDMGSGTPDTTNTEGTPSTGGNEEPVEAKVDEDVSNATDEVVFDTSTFTGGIGDRNVLTLPALFQTDNETVARNTITIIDNDTSTTHKLDITPIDRLRAQFTGFNAPLQLVASDSFISKLNEAREEIVLENRTFDMVVGGSMSISAGLSVGYAIWLARSGVLMSGLLSSMPAWAFIDPLPVLASMGAKDDEDEEDDESLESMVEEKEGDKR